ncbi:MAG: hypothetical protein LQ341_001586 [Variospora aurantia]|nr:MAG: hypothetical protein LQ341_001586 [Variospora aurantia]
MNEPSGFAADISRSESAAQAHSALSPYQMHVIIDPPGEARPGDALIPAPTIMVRFRGHVQEEAIQAQDITNYWAFASLVSEDGRIALAPPSTSLVSGRLIGTIREPNDADDGEVGYAIFKDLCIHQPGSFRLRISLMRMPTADSEASEAEGVLNTGNVVTRVIHVHDGAQVPPLEQRNYAGEQQPERK